MDSWSINVELLSETIFGSGQALPGAVDLEIVHDEFGLPYLKGKTLKGKLREEVKAIVDLIKEQKLQLDFDKYINTLFGAVDKDCDNKIKFSDCTIPSNVKKGIEYGIKNRIFSKDEVLRSLTNFRDYTSIDENGVAKKGSLRRYRAIKKGLYFVADLHIEGELDEIEKGLLAAGIRALGNLGSMVSRGKGEVKLSLLFNEKDVTDQYLEILEKEVKRS